ncbi:hypothetical protein AcV5_009599 [Taiwanofungus camphoratus]|nr:hypothetical protein AcV5_009599 [Antrodia cinnamomea]KAI0942970.1 hypothetical protein AcV7_002243 [Antrodia cinnamomea]
MGTRPKVPAALHSELSEYAALLRALRTNDNLDLALQLTRATSTPTSDRVGLAVDGDGESERPLSDSVSQDALHDEFEVSPTNVRRTLKRRASASGSPSKKERVRDTWTRWPLMTGDVHVPEWSLEDEVKLIALQTLKSEPFSAPGEGVPASDQDGDDSSLSLPNLHALTSDSAIHLSRILALLAAHVPPAEKSMQNRVRPINWETVLEVVGANRLVEANVLHSVRQRMERMYGPSPLRAVERLRVMHSVEQRLVNACSAHELSFLALPGYDPTASLPKRKRGPYRKRQKVASQGVTNVT